MKTVKYVLTDFKTWKIEEYQLQYTVALPARAG